MKRTVRLEVILLATLVGCIPGLQPQTSAQETRPAENSNSKPQQEISTQGIRPDIRFEPDILTSPISGKQLIRAKEGNCPVDEQEIVGQGSHVRDSIGGLAVFPNPVDKNGVSIPRGSPIAVGTQMFATAKPSFDKPAAIIVFDDFNSDLGFTQPVEALRGDPKVSGVYFLDQQRGPTLAGLVSGATGAEAEGLEAAGQYSHGALVFNHTLALLAAEDANPKFSSLEVSVSDSAEIIRVPIIDFTKLNVIVVALDTQDFNTGIIGERLQATIQVLAEQGIGRFAINMSFGLVPCSVRTDFRDAKSGGRGEQLDLTFEEYRDAVFEENKDKSGLDPAEFREQLTSILTTPVNEETDPLLKSTKTNEEFADITYLAASGNYRLPYSLYPGYWPEFVSVSAQNLADTSTPAVRDSDYSNTGEVLMPGGYFRLTAYDPNTKGWRVYPQISVAGTSFSAPVLSVFTALDFTRSTPRCARVSPSVTSPLAFFKTDPPVALPIPDLNLALEDALSKYCP